MNKLNFYFYSPVAFEKWDWRNSVEKGIGGSETSHVEMAWRLANRGHNVVTYAPIPDDCPGEWRGTKWYPLEEATFQEPGIWILYRCPPIVEKFDHSRKDQQIWFIMQDWDYPDWTDEIIKNTDRIITLCQWHGKDTIRNHPLIRHNMWLTSNGVKADLAAKIDEEKIKRNPKKIMYASSPDRGLKNLLISFKRAREYDPELELHAFYGYNNLNKLIEGNDKHPLAKQKRETEALMDQPNVFFHGRVSQEELYRQWQSSGIWVYQTSFLETSCITSMEAQSNGAIPIFSPVGALAENVKWGIPIVGNPEDSLTYARFAAEIIRVTRNEDFWNQVRPNMMEWARKRFDWEVFVDQWIAEAEDRRSDFEQKYEFPKQL